MASAQVVETSVTNNSPSQDSYHPDDLFQSRYNKVMITTSDYSFERKCDATSRRSKTIQFDKGSTLELDVSSRPAASFSLSWKFDPYTLV